MFEAGLWVWSSAHHQAAKVIESSSLWGDGYSRLWLSQSDSVVRIANEHISPLGKTISSSPDQIAYIAAAARIAASQTEDILLAPIGSNVILLPHQLKALNKAISKTQVRYLLADEVGLGKTIEAGLVMRELKLRGLVRRILRAAPKGLATQNIIKEKSEYRFNARQKTIERSGLLEVKDYRRAKLEKEMDDRKV